jgi:hypothetical protein
MRMSFLPVLRKRRASTEEFRCIKAGFVFDASEGPVQSGPSAFRPRIYRAMAFRASVRCLRARRKRATSSSSSPTRSIAATAICDIC